MMPTNENFLDSVNFISENQAEYSILTDLYQKCPGMIFTFELSELSIIKNYCGDIVKYIKNNYRSFDLRKFSLQADGNISDVVLENKSGSSYKDVELFNYAMKISTENQSYILVRAKGALVLYHNGLIEKEFENIFADKQALIELDNNKKNIDQLEWVFEDFHTERKFSGCDYIIGNKVKNSVSERQLRNHLTSYLIKSTKLHIVPELCTSQKEDEESVDIGVIDSDNRVAIIEVKYFVKKGFFENPNKNSAYSTARFKDGYRQLNRYCIHLNTDNYNLHSAYLYMFFAHSNSLESIKKIAHKYLIEYQKSPDTDCSIAFNNHFKATIYDNMIDVRNA